MKIEILLVEDINESTTGGTCFEASRFIADGIRNFKPVQGVVIINGEATKFSFSCLGMDGDIFTSNPVHRVMVKRLVPLFMYERAKNYAVAS